jgi:F-type H+-transporting ATPase subunit alpha
LDLIGDAEVRIQQRVLNELPELCERMEAGERLDDSQWQKLLSVASDALYELKNRPQD